ncbi:hypothetical protein IFM89_005101 [Coptis chinensis]|uniref:PGG domain-containing protein n=1 Tax=Coptis chinensis TaxID=261450 RepID=A0A835M7B5_9MAGN|nr:hypothetical protein IFM89_005101 [Coptis chinensis]
MDPYLFQIITKGDISTLRQTPLNLLYQKTAIYNSALHVAVQFERKECVEEILQRCPLLLWSTNLNGDTALHFAAREGLSSITELLLIHSSKSVHENEGLKDGVRLLLKTANKEKDTALHEAVRNCHQDVVILLTEADPDFEYFANNTGETPLFLAAEKRYCEMVSQILGTCPSSAHGGPNGMTALHAAAMNHNPGIMRIMLEKKPTLIRQADHHGWTPLHYAAYANSSGIIIQLLEFDRFLAYIPEENGMSPLHIATSKGYARVMTELIQRYPDCQELPDTRGRNFLHIAVVRKEKLLIETVLIESTMTKYIINQPDNDGNTPLHLAAIYKDYDIVKFLSEDTRVNKSTMNKEKLTPLTILETKTGPGDDLTCGSKYWEAIAALKSNGASQSWREGIFKEDLQEPPTWSRPELQEMHGKYREKITQQIQKVSESHLVVATLIATVTFAAAFALPGGYKNDGPDEGMATLLRKTSFEVFAISNTIAMVFSSLAVCIHFVMKLIDHDEKTHSLLIKAFLCTFVAISAMMLAFVTGTYAVLAHSSALAISACIIGCSFYLFSFFLLHKYYKDIKMAFNI